MHAHRHRIVLLKTGFRYGDRAGLFSRARLYADRIELTNWSCHGPELRQIPLDMVDHVEWESEDGQTNAVICMDGGRRIPLRLQHVNRWRQTLESCLRWSRPGGDREARRGRALNLPLKDLVAYTTSMS